MSSNKLIINKNEVVKEVEIPLCSSKSESNRVLIINALANSPGELNNLSDARDTQTMLRLLKEYPGTLDVLDAGTTMRFLTAYAAIKGEEKILTGTPRMCQRPIKILVDALREIGAEISYLKNDGYPPHQILGFNGQASSEITVKGDVSSQYISALMMIAPILPNGLQINLTGKIGSRPYIEMTMALMKKFGAEVSFVDSCIKVSPKKYHATSYTVESDWSGASYWFSVVALADSG